MACPPGPFITLFSEADTRSELAGGRALPHPREECSRDRVVGQTWAGACCVTWGLCDLGQDPGLLGLHVLAFGVGTRHPLFLVSWAPHSQRTWAAF